MRMFKIDIRCCKATKIITWNRKKINERLPHWRGEKNNGALQLLDVERWNKSNKPWRLKKLGIRDPFHAFSSANTTSQKWNREITAKEEKKSMRNANTDCEEKIRRFFSFSFAAIFAVLNMKKPVKYHKISYGNENFSLVQWLSEKNWQKRIIKKFVAKLLPFPLNSISYINLTQRFKYYYKEWKKMAFNKKHLKN